MKPVKAHTERRVEGKYPGTPYIAVVSRGEVLGAFQDQDAADIFAAGFDTGAQRQAAREGDPVD